MKLIFHCFLFFSACNIFSQNTEYIVSFENAEHHEISVEVSFKDIKVDTAVFRMARSSPGRYALHEFAKNVYSVRAENDQGKELNVFRPDPYSWAVVGHTGYLKIHYTLFANRADGTYSQVDESHAHLNMPATFMYMPELSDHEMLVNFKPRTDLNWKIATQLEKMEENKYRAPNLQYFMDSPTELSDFYKGTFVIEGPNGRQKINLVVHDSMATQLEFEEYLKHTESIVKTQQKIIGELPKFDFGEYTFLACYMPQVNGDGMEHRNSTVLTSTRSLSQGGIQENIGTVSHEFFHCWNVERIRPASLEPFNFEKANMSGALWFAEGFTNYYDALSLTRAKIWDLNTFLVNESYSFNYVWTSPGRNYFNPIEMSQQAPFVDAATALDPNNRENTYISYYNYGEMLGFALDLTLRQIGKSLDAYMKLVWQRFGKTEKPYEINDLKEVLASYTNQELANNFFQDFIYDSQIPNFTELLSIVGVRLEQREELSWGALVRYGKVMSNPFEDSTAYLSGLQMGDIIEKIDTTPITQGDDLNAMIKNLDTDIEHSIVVKRFGTLIEKPLVLKPWTEYKLKAQEELELTAKQKEARRLWLQQ
ncbi:M61 family metallopeptidase [Aegicerativicinus sediminis]